MSRGNNVRGPTSALTEFLRESGITPTLIARRAQQAEQQTAEAGPSNRNGDGENEAEGSTRPGTRRTRSNRVADGFDSDDLDDEKEQKSPSKKRKLTKKEQEKLKAKEKAKAKRGKRRGGDDDDDFEDDSDDDEYTALSRGAIQNRDRAATSAKPPVGSFETCAECEKQFTVTRYTVAADPGPGWLCHVCVKKAGIDPFKKTTAPRKRKAPEEKRKVVSFEERELPSLASLCISIISDYIDDVEALGQISATSKYEIGRVLARNRSLNAENAKLLYDVQNTELKLTDATNIGPNALCTLADLNPNLTRLHLDLCGRMNDDVCNYWADRLPALKRLELYGPFLVRTAAWPKFFESHPDLTGFLIRQSPRFDVDCMASLAQHCTDLTELRLSEIGKMSDEFLGYVKGFEHLTSLDLGDQTASLSTDAVVDLLKTVGPRLTHLNLSKNEKLEDAVLTEGLGPHCRVLTSLILEDLPGVSDEAVATFFKETANEPMRIISFSRNSQLSDGTLSGLLSHSGSKVEDLKINSMKDVSNEALLTIGECAKKLRTLDMGFCRQADDFVVKAIMDGCKYITDIQVFGCNRLTESCPRKRGVNVRGVETHAV